jgi:predicted outer membrane repeat protein
MFRTHPFSENLQARREGRGPATRLTHHRRCRRRSCTAELLEARTLLSTFTVNSLGDTGAGTGTSGDLRYVITHVDQTSGANTINFSVTGTIMLNSALPDLSNTTGLTDIEGPGAASLTVARSSAAGTPNFSVFTIDNNVEVQLAGLTITGGLSGMSGGGGIDNSGTLTVDDSAIENNSAPLVPSPGGGAMGTSGGGIENAGDLTVVDATVDNNSATSSGGGINNDGRLTLTNSTIDDNRAGSSAGITVNGPTTITNSTITNNSTGENGGGIFLAFFGIPLTVTNSTIAYNQSGSLGGGLNTGGHNPMVSLYNTIVALNTATVGGADISGTVSPSSASNLIGTGGSGGLTNGTNGNQVGVAEPGLGTLASNGGPTQTIALLPGSPAIDKGSNTLAVDANGQPLVYDQRGPGFPRIVNGTVDIGAFEVQSASVTVIASSVEWGSQIAALQTAPDFFRLLPAGRNTDMPWLGINRLQITLNEPASLSAGDVSVSSAIGVNYGPVTVSGSGTSYTITLAQPINQADRVWIIVAGPGLASFIRRLDVLPGDFNDDGVVNSQDMVGIRNEFLGFAGAVPTIFGDINGDGIVDINDYTAVRKLLFTTLPPIA